MNLQQLYYFQAISRLKNYTKAAEQLLVAQSSLSHSIGDLERELGVPLFFKVGRNIDITEYGKQFLIHVDRITAELELANQELKNIDDVFRRFQLTPNIIQEVDTEKVMASAVASGLGVALMPRMTELSIYDVVPLTLENSELHRPMFMCWPKGETLRPVVKNFRDYIMDRVGELPS